MAHQLGKIVSNFLAEPGLSQVMHTSHRQVTLSFLDHHLLLDIRLLIQVEKQEMFLKENQGIKC